MAENTREPRRQPKAGTRPTNDSALTREQTDHDSIAASPTEEELQ